jgi:tetratricopeptide (TPR) repeat protein
MIYWIALGFIIASLAVIAVVILRKFPQLVIIDVGTMVKEQQAKMKDNIIWQRIVRKAKERGKPVISAGAEIKHGLSGFFNKIYSRAQDLEKKYTLERRAAKPAKKSLADESKIENLVSEAEKSANEDCPHEAEEKYIEIISLDPHNVEAYRGLARVYFKTKQFKEAQETLDFIIKLGKADDRIYNLLGEIAYSQGDYQTAKDQQLAALGKKPGVISYHIDLAKAYIGLDDRVAAQSTLAEAKEFEPKNPKILDFLVENSIILGKKDEAKKYFKEFKALNPENAKISEWEAKIKQIK